MAVPLLDLSIQNLALEGELKAAFERVLHSGKFILGPEVDALEEKIAAMIGVRHAIGVSSGTDAILLALMALDVGPDAEVICPSFTFFATAGCIARLGAKPIFVDSCPVCFNLDVAAVARKITARTKAIVPVHLFGQAADMAALMELADRHGLPVIEDAAQSLGAAYRGRPLGSFGSFGVFSFFPSKNLGGFGDGGIVVTNDERLASKARSLRVHGAKPKYHHKYVGGNFRLDPLQAALLSVKLPHYRQYTDARRANAALYDSRLRQIPGIGPGGAPTETCPHGGAAEWPAETRIGLPVTHVGRDHIWNQYTLRVIGEGRRDALRAALGAKGIGTEIYYPVPLHRQECFAYLGPAESLPVAERLSLECVSIPIFPELTAAQKGEVIDAVAHFASAFDAEPVAGGSSVRR